MLCLVNPLNVCIRALWHAYIQFTWDTYSGQVKFSSSHLLTVSLLIHWVTHHRKQHSAGRRVIRELCDTSYIAGVQQRWWCKEWQRDAYFLSELSVEELRADASSDFCEGLTWNSERERENSKISEVTYGGLLCHFKTAYTMLKLLSLTRQNPRDQRHKWTVSHTFPEVEHHGQGGVSGD